MTCIPDSSTTSCGREKGKDKDRQQKVSTPTQLWIYGTHGKEHIVIIPPLYKNKLVIQFQLLNFLRGIYLSVLLIRQATGKSSIREEKERGRSTYTPRFQR